MPHERRLRECIELARGISKHVVKTEGITKPKEIVRRRAIQSHSRANIDLLCGSDSKATARVEDLAGHSAARMIGDVLGEEVGARSNLPFDGERLFQSWIARRLA